ncbi:MAG: hypothetical protein KIS92_01700 [Planctomycetota bacterium]|nr:hypothetical protein [Planctomycetota bacterium]
MRAIPVLLSAMTMLSMVSAAEKLPERWVYAKADLGSDAGLETFVSLMKESKASGCTHALLIEGRFLRWSEDATYLARVEKAKAAAKAEGITLVPNICSTGYSGRYFHFDPNLMAGLPVKQMPFIVKNGKASADPAGALDLGTLKPDGNGLRGMLKVKPFQQYKITFTLKGKYEGDRDDLLRVMSPDAKRWISRATPVLKDADEQTVVYCFNSLDNSEVRAQILPRDAKIENVKIELAGTLMIVRRPLVPLTVTSEDGQTVYEEGKDFKSLHDADMLKKPFDGEFTIDRAPADLELAEGSRIKDGEKLLLTFWHGYRVGSDQDIMSLEDPKAMEILEMELKNCIKVWQPAGIFLNYDEMRIAGWEPMPDGKPLKPGEMLAKHFKVMYEKVRAAAPEAKVYTWSDMFTPHHNARPFGEKGYYYLVNGNWDGSWEALPKDVIILNWYAPKAESIKFFADRGNPQVLCGFYDGKTDQKMKNNIGNWMKVSAGQPGILGFMYTTWTNDYKHLKRYFELVDTYEQWSAPEKVVKEKEPGVKE